MVGPRRRCEVQFPKALGTCNTQCVLVSFKPSEYQIDISVYSHSSSYPNIFPPRAFSPTSSNLFRNELTSAAELRLQFSSRHQINMKKTEKTSY